MGYGSEGRAEAGGTEGKWPAPSPHGHRAPTAADSPPEKPPAFLPGASLLGKSRGMGLPRPEGVVVQREKRGVRRGKEESSAGKTRCRDRRRQGEAGGDRGECGGKGRQDGSSQIGSSQNFLPYIDTVSETWYSMDTDSVSEHGIFRKRPHGAAEAV